MSGGEEVVEVDLEAVDEDGEAVDENEELGIGATSKGSGKEEVAEAEEADKDIPQVEENPEESFHSEVKTH